MMNKAIIPNSITTVSVLLRTRVLSPVQLIQTSLGVMNATKELNAFISEISQEDAMNQAQDSKERIQTNKARSKLEGIPIGIKDNFTTIQFKTTCGSKMLSNYHPSSFDCTVIKKLVTESGAILIGKTNMDEFAMGSGTTDSHFGPTINPWKSRLESASSFSKSSYSVDDHHKLKRSDPLTDNHISSDCINKKEENSLERNGTSVKDKMPGERRSDSCGDHQDGINALNDVHRAHHYPQKQQLNPTVTESNNNHDTCNSASLVSFGHGSQNGPVQLNSSLSSLPTLKQEELKMNASRDGNILNSPSSGPLIINHPTNDHDTTATTTTTSHVAISNEKRELRTENQSIYNKKSQTISNELIINSSSEGSKLVNDWYIAGGSSGGSAVAVATGSVFAAIGSDTGGSTRHPAALVGVLGFKPTYGLISRHGLVALTHSMDTVGIMTRYARDAALVLECLVGHDEKDSTSIADGMARLIDRSNGKGFDPNFNLKELKIGIPVEYKQEFLGDQSKDGEEILNVWNQIVKLFEDNGSAIKDVSLPRSKYVGATYMVINSTEVASNFSCYDGIEFGHRANEYDNTDGKQLKQQEAKFKTAGQLSQETRSVFGTNVKSRIIAGNYFLLTSNQEKYLKQALKVRRLICQDYQNVFKGFDHDVAQVKELRVNYRNNHTTIRDSVKNMNVDIGVHNHDTNLEVDDDDDDGRVDFILTPATIRSAVTISEWRKKRDNQQQAMKEDYLTTGANLAGIPAVTFPVTLSEKGLPLSLQLVGNHFTDFRLLSVADQIQQMINFPFLSFGNGTR